MRSVLLVLVLVAACGTDPRPGGDSGATRDVGMNDAELDASVEDAATDATIEDSGADTDDDAASPDAALVCTGDATQLDFDDRGTMSVASIMEPGVTITASGSIWVREFNGLGVVGGSTDHLGDSESMTFEFDPPVADVSYRVTGIGLGDGDDMRGELFVEAFDAAAASLGTELLFGTGNRTDMLNETFGSVAMSRVVLQAAGDGMFVEWINFTPCTP